MSNSLHQGIQLVREGDIEAACTVFQDILSKDSKDASAYLWLGNSQVLLGNLKEARKSFLSAQEYGEEQIQQEARRQLNSIWYNRVLGVLVLRPPLRFLLLLVVIGYALSILLRLGNLPKASYWVQLVSVYGFLPLFFIWAFFIISYFIGNIAFEGDEDADFTKRLRFVIGLAGVFVLPANLFISQGIGVKILAIFLDVFLVSLGLSRLLNWLGRRLAGEESIGILQHIASSAPAMQEARVHVEDKDPS